MDTETALDRLLRMRASLEKYASKAGANAVRHLRRGTIHHYAGAFAQDAARRALNMEALDLAIAALKQEPQPSDDKILLAADVAKRLDITPSGVHHLYRTGRLSAERSEGGVYLFRDDEVERLATERESRRNGQVKVS